MAVFYSMKGMNDTITKKCCTFVRVNNTQAFYEKDKPDSGGRALY